MDSHWLLGLLQNSTIIGIVWFFAQHLIKSYFDRAKKIESLKEQNLKIMFDGMNRLFESTAARVTNLEKSLSEVSAEFSAKFEEMESTFQKYAGELSASHGSILSAQKSFLEELKKLQSYTLKHVGEDAYRVTAKKKGP